MGQRTRVKKIILYKEWGIFISWQSPCLWRLYNGASLILCHAVGAALLASWSASPFSMGMKSALFLHSLLNESWACCSFAFRGRWV